MTNKTQTQKEIIKDLDERITVLEDRPYYPPSMVDNLGKAPTQEDLACRCGDTDYSAKPMIIPTMMTDTSESNKSSVDFLANSPYKGDEKYLLASREHINPKRLNNNPQFFDKDGKMVSKELCIVLEDVIKCQYLTYENARRLILACQDKTDKNHVKYYLQSSKNYLCLTTDFVRYLTNFYNLVDIINQTDDDPEVSLDPNDEDEPVISDELEPGDKISVGSLAKMDGLITDELEYEMVCSNLVNKENIHIRIVVNMEDYDEWLSITTPQRYQTMFLYQGDKDIYHEFVYTDSLVIGQYNSNCYAVTRQIRLIS